MEDRTIIKDTTEIADRTTRLVEKQKKPYQGFITDEELEYAEKTARSEHEARAARQAAAREELSKTRIYEGLGTGLGGDKEEKPKEDAKPARRVRTINISLSDSRKVKRLIALIAVFAVLLAFDISYFVLKAKAGSIPAETQAVRAQTEEISTENEALQQQAEEMGDPDQIRDTRDSWQRIRDRLAE